jgi:hypothetical protein
MWSKWLKNFDTHTIAIPTGTIQEFGYEPGLPDTDHSERFGISMFHQLHCLVRVLGTTSTLAYCRINELTRRIQATVREFAYLPDTLRMPNGQPLDHDGVSFSPFHMDHCFNYLRQAIECFADSTVEWAKIDDRGMRHGIQGWNIRYECRDRGALEAFAMEHHEV